MHEHTNALISKWTSNIMNKRVNEQWASVSDLSGTEEPVWSSTVNLIICEVLRHDAHPGEPQ